MINFPVRLIEQLFINIHACIIDFDGGEFHLISLKTGRQNSQEAYECNFHSQFFCFLLIQLTIS